MKNLALLIVFLFLSFSVNSQNTPADQVAVGDILVIEGPSTHNYKHIDFPKANIIYKRGGIPNFDDLYQSQVKVIETTTKKDGSKEVVLQRVDGKKFFNAFPTVSADLTKALNSGELVKKG